MTQHLRLSARSLHPALPIVLLRASAAAPVTASATEPADAAPRQRRRIWELSPDLHCSIVGTCLSAAGLRRILVKAGSAEAGASDHDLHKRAVGSASQPNGPAKLLNKALDREHQLAIKQFARAASEDELRALWRAARERGDIPGAYWAVLTHPAATSALIAEAFGDVHMLSHLVGSANRADIRRLSALAAEKAELEAKLARQQQQLRDAVRSREAKIRDLNDLLARHLAREAAARPQPEERAGDELVAQLERQLGRQSEHARLLEQRCEAMRRDLAHERELRLTAERQQRALGEELAALEASLADGVPDAEREAAPRVPGLAGMTLLYVGGRPGQVRQLRAVAESSGAVFLSHDGGVEDNASLLPALANRADAVLFPLDCVSHAALAAVKPLCRQRAKPYVPLRTSGLGAFVAALGRLAAMPR